MKYSRTSPHQRDRSRGLTLIELVVVMVVLVALAGIVLPKITGMVTRAHTSSQATNMSEIAKALQTYEAEYSGYPNGLDSLANPTTGAIANYVAGNRGTTTPFNDTSEFVTVTLTSDTLAALNSAGIRTVTPISTTTLTGDFSPTFYPYGTVASVVPTPTTLSSSSVLAGMNSIAAAREFGTSSLSSYIVLGIGKYSSMQGTVMQDAPVHFDDDPLGSPTKAYARVGVVFQITDSSGEALDRARYVGSVGFHSDKMSGLGSHLQEYFETTNQ
jgi:prepilin-type N-terminal cleavage/methylation domain-containing protein